MDTIAAEAANHAVAWKGFVGAAIAVLCFGTYAVPVKLVPTGDGMAFQWIQCCMVLVIGYIAQAIAGYSHQLEPLAMVGGVLWCIGNATVVPIVGSIGLSLGPLLWGITNMLAGWCAGHFGIWVPKESVAHPALNYAGVVVAVMSFFLYFPVRTSIEAPQDDDGVHVEDASDGSIMASSDEGSVPVDGWDVIGSSAGHVQAAVDKEPLLAASVHRSPIVVKTLGIVGSIVAGLFYGVNMLPVTVLQNRHPNYNPLAFALSHFSGIFLCSTVILAGYSVFKRNRPYIHQRSILGAMVAGALWATAQCGWFFANANLKLVVAFPIVCTGPGVVAVLWGVLAFKEVQGRRNILLLLGAFSATMLGIVLITLSQ